jgi:hypothetical protein
MSSIWLVTTISLIFMVALSVVISSQSINAMKVQDTNFQNTGSTIGPICNNDSKLCYADTTQEEVKVAEKNYEPMQTAKNSDLHNETISAIQAAETRKKVYEEGLSKNQNSSWKVMTGILDSVPEIHTDRLPTERHEIAIILPPNAGKIYEGY